MSSFFSFVTYRQKPYYIPLHKRSLYSHPDWHSIICQHFKLNCDRVNKYEIVVLDNNRFNIVQINDFEDDSEYVEKWTKSFLKSAEYLTLLNYTIENNNLVWY